MLKKYARLGTIPYGFFFCFLLSGCATPYPLPPQHLNKVPHISASFIRQRKILLHQQKNIMKKHHNNLKQYQKNTIEEYKKSTISANNIINNATKSPKKLTKISYDEKV